MILPSESTGQIKKTHMNMSSVKSLIANLSTKLAQRFLHCLRPLSLFLIPNSPSIVGVEFLATEIFSILKRMEKRSNVIRVMTGRTLHVSTTAVQIVWGRTNHSCATSAIYPSYLHLWGRRRVRHEVPNASESAFHIYMCIYHIWLQRNGGTYSVE